MKMLLKELALEKKADEYHLSLIMEMINEEKKPDDVIIEEAKKMGYYGEEIFAFVQGAKWYHKNKKQCNNQ